MSTVVATPPVQPTDLLTGELSPAPDLERNPEAEQGIVNSEKTAHDAHLLWEDECARASASYYEGPLND